MPEQIAELLDLPSVTFAKHIEVDGGTVKVQRQTEAGYDEVECPLPAVVSVTAGVVEPRYPSFKGIMAAKSQAGRRGHRRRPRPRRRRSAGPAPARRSSPSPPAEARQAGEIVEDDGEGYEKIVAFLENLKVI